MTQTEQFLPKKGRNNLTARWQKNAARLRRIVGPIALLPLLASCQSGSDELQGEEPTEQLSPITFSGMQSEERELTRASSLQDAGTTTFLVWGYKNMTEDGGTYDADASTMQTVFPRYTVKWQSGSAATTTTNSSGWEYILMDPADQTIKYWDWSARAYRFFAATNWLEDDGTPYAAQHTYGTATTYNTTCRAYQLTMLADASSADSMDVTPFFSRLWFSTGDPMAFPDRQFGKTVQLEFLKPFARVRFILIYSNSPEGIRINGKAFAPTDSTKNIVRKGTVTVTYPLTGPKTSEWYGMTHTTTDDEAGLDAFTEDYIPDGGPSKEIWYYVLPNNEQGSYTMSITMNNDPTPKTAVVPATYMQWLPGYSYTYIFKILEEGGVEIEDVQSAVTPWWELATNRTVYNW